MKKLTAILMSLLVLLSMAACDKKDDKPNATAHFIKTERPVKTAGPNEVPSDEELDVLYRYSEILSALDFYAQNGRFDKSFAKSCDGHQGHEFYGVACNLSDNQWVLSYCYEQIQAMSAVDKWIHSHWGNAEGFTTDRQTVLAKFTVLEDRFIRTMYQYTDALGQPLLEYAEVATSVDYNEKGDMIISRSGDGLLFVGRSESRYLEMSYVATLDKGVSHYTYNDNGTIANIDVGHYEEKFLVDARMTPAYDSQGRISTMKVLFANGEETTVEYFYDAQGRLVKVHNLAGYMWTYEYDSNGNLLKETESYDYYSNTPIVMTYTYDDKNHLKAVCYDSNRREGVYTYDEKGHLSSFQTTENEGTTRTVTYDYGNYYIYHPAG